MEKYTVENWKRDGVLRLLRGVVYDDEIIYTLIEGMPPTWNKYGVFQVGEANTCDANGVLLYSTFILTYPHGWQYVGDITPLTNGEANELLRIHNPRK